VQLPRHARLLFVCAALATACGDELRNQIGERLQQGLTPVDAPAPEGAPLPPELISNKLSLYVDCANSTRVPLYAGFREVNAALRAGKKARAENITPVLEEWLEPCVKAQREGPLLQPPLPDLELLSRLYLASARELAAAIGAFRESLTEKPGAPVDDTTDPRTRFNAAFERWDEARQALDQEIDARQASVDAAVLAEVEQRSGKGLEWHARDLMRAARPYVRCLGDHDEITAKICAGLHTPFDQAHRAFQAIVEADPAGVERVFWMPQFVASLAEYHDAADALREALRDNKASAADIGLAIREYNDLVRDFAAINFAAAASAPPASP
jgi:tetratricopeptide (TPR) repeat protein